MRVTQEQQVIHLSGSIASDTAAEGAGWKRMMGTEWRCHQSQPGVWVGSLVGHGEHLTASEETM